MFCGRPDCGDMPKLVSIATPSRMRGHARTAAEVTGDVARRAAEQRLRALGRGAVAGAVEAVAAHAELSVHS